MNKNIFKKILIAVCFIFVFNISNVFAEDVLLVVVEPSPEVSPAPEIPEPVIPVTTNIHLKIFTPDNIFYDADVAITSCDSDNDPATDNTISAYCAVLQSGVTSSWNWEWKPGAFVNSINDVAGYTSKDSSGGDVYHYWSWSVNGTFGQTGLNEYIPNENDSISIEFIDPKPEIAKTNIHLSVVNGDQYIYNNDVSVAPCDSDGDSSTPDVATPYCALNDAKVENSWGGLWINSIGGISNDYEKNIFWMWMANLDFTNFNLSSKQYTLKDGDNIIFYFNTTPLNIFVDKSNPVVGDIITVSVKELGFDASWNPVWNPALGGKVKIGQDVFDLDSNGEYKITVLDKNPIIIEALKTGYVNTKILTINPGDNPNTNNESSGGGSSGGGSSTVKEFSIDRAFQFLISKQNSDGSYNGEMYTDWAAIALSQKSGASKEKIKEYLISNDIDSSVLTDYERRAMALMSLGVSPYDGTGMDYIKKIIDSFDGTQFGDSSLVNDDIFAVLVLKNAGYGENDEIIKKDISYIISQDNNGSWGSVDMTAALVQALSGLEGVDGVSDAVSRANNFIISNSSIFNNPFTASWIMQSGVETIKTNEYMISIQGEDGGISIDGGDIDSRLWATSYAIPAILNKSWDSLLKNFNKIDYISPSPKASDNVSSIKEIAEPVLFNEAASEDFAVSTDKPTEKPIVKTERIKTNIKKDVISTEEFSNEIETLNPEPESVLDKKGFWNTLGNFWLKIRGIFSWLFVGFSF